MNVSGFQKSLGKTTVSTDMDVGPAKIRSRFTKSVDTYTCEIFIDFDDIDTFETFYKTTLGNGSLPFTFDDPFTQSQESFRFIGQPVIDPLGGREFVIRMSWEKLP